MGPYVATGCFDFKLTFLLHELHWQDDRKIEYGETGTPKRNPTS